MTEKKRGPRPKPPRAATPDDFWAYLPQRQYWYLPTRTLWPGETINSILGDGAAHALDNEKPTHQATWCPGMPMIIRGRVVVKNAWCDQPGANTFNLYMPPRPIEGDANKAGPWRAHGEKIFGDDLAHIERWLAYRVQHPDVKINHGLVLGSPKQGIGKDSYLAPVRRGVGEWNFGDITAKQAYDGQNRGKNGFLENVILRLNEAHDLGEKRFSYYDLTKDWMAAPPETMMVEDKWVKQHPIFNTVGTITTTNHKTDGLFLPPDDRRHYVAWTDITPDDFESGYWGNLWNWFTAGGMEHAAAYLATLDVSAFNPKLPPPKTDAFWEIVNANLSAEDAELADVLDAMGADPAEIDAPERPDAVTLVTLKRQAARDEDGELFKWLDTRANRRAIPHRLEKLGYVPVRNESDKRDGLWMIAGRRDTIYARASLNHGARLAAAGKLKDSEQRHAARLAAKARRAS